MIKESCPHCGAPITGEKFELIPKKGTLYTVMDEESK